MDFTFSEQQIAFRDAASRFLMTEAAPEMLREIWESDVGRSPQLRAKLAAQGLTSLSVAEVHGGSSHKNWAITAFPIRWPILPVLQPACWLAWKG